MFLGWVKVVERSRNDNYEAHLISTYDAFYPLLRLPPLPHRIENKEGFKPMKIIGMDRPGDDGA